MYYAIEQNFISFFCIILYKSTILAFLGICWTGKVAALMMDMNIDVIQLRTVIYFLWNALGKFKFCMSDTPLSF